MKNHKCNGCRYKGEHQEMMFRPMGVCTKTSNLVEAVKFYNAEKCPFKKTNFSKITESVESLAEFIDSLNLIDCNACVGKSICDCHIRDCKDVFIKWLLKEIDDEEDK